MTERNETSTPRGARGLHVGRFELYSRPIEKRTPHGAANVWGMRQEYRSVSTDQSNRSPSDPQAIRQSFKQDKHKKRAVRLLVERDGLYCHYCGIPLEAPLHGYNALGLSIDHIQPISEGGSNDLGNLVLACRQCNGRKRTKSYQEYRLSLEIDATLMFLMGLREK